MKRMVLIIVLVLALAISSCGCTFRKQDGVTQTDTIYYLYNSLTYTQQEIYNELLEDAVKITNTFEVFDATDTDVLPAYTALINDHPELFWLSDGVSYSTYDYFALIPVLDIYATDITVFSMEINDDLKTKKTELDKKVQEIAALANAYSSDYEKVLFVHDYIIENTEYDRETLEIYESLETLDKVYNASTAYGCLVEGKAICSGYAKGFQLVMQELGFVCGNAFGVTKEENESHQWNYILLDNEYYYVDATWDDVEKVEGFAEYKCYDYFLIDDAELSYSHELENEVLSPTCEGEKYDYYVVNELFDSDNYDYATTKKIIQKQLDNDYFVIKYSSPEECKKAVNDLFNNSRIFNVSGRFNSVKYLVSNTGDVIYVSKG